MTAALRRALLVVFAVVVCALPAFAHETRPAYLELVETAKDRFDVVWKVPTLNGPPLAGEEIPHVQPPLAHAGESVTAPCGCRIDLGAIAASGVLPIHPAFPANARPASLPTVERRPGTEIRRWTMVFDAPGADGYVIGVHGIETTRVDVLVRVVTLDGRTITRVLRADTPRFTLDLAGGTGAAEYLSLGVEHILLGADHLLFVLGLLLIVPGRAMLLKTITAFTIAHSVTLAIATLGWASAPVAPLNASIAMSILFLGPEIVRARRGETSLTIRRPWIVAFAFGLLHGFGFASGLTSLGIPRAEIPLALLLFNVGVELGQLAFVALIVALAASFRKLEIRWPRAVAALPAYAVGTLGALWTIQRTVMLLGGAA